MNVSRRRLFGLAAAAAATPVLGKVAKAMPKLPVGLLRKPAKMTIRAGLPIPQWRALNTRGLIYEMNKTNEILEDLEWKE